MKVLFISDNRINGFGGGCVENKKHYAALKKYCGTKHILKVISTDKNFEDSLEVSLYKNKILDILVRLLGHSSFLYFTILLDGEKIREYNPDIIYLGRSRFGFIAKWAKKIIPECKIITNIDNVEFDYVDAYFSDEKGITGLLKRNLEKNAVKRDERLTIQYSDKLIFLTKRNVERYETLYEYKESKPCILPVCLGKSKELKKLNNQRNIVFIGSLDYAANINAVLKLLSIWKRNFIDNKDVILTIAGRNPSNEIINNVKHVSNIRLISDFDDVTDVVSQDSLMLAPIENGAGMKIKVAESLSLGLSVAGSQEALVGYEEAINYSRTKGSITRCLDDESYLLCINQHIKKSEEELKKIEEEQKNIFYKFYSYERSNRVIADIIDESLEQK